MKSLEIVFQSFQNLGIFCCLVSEKAMKWVCNKFEMSTMHASAFYMPTWERAKSMTASHFYVPTCQRCANYSIWHANMPKEYQLFNFVCQKVHQFFNYFSKEFFNFWIFQLSLTLALQISRPFGQFSKIFPAKKKQLLTFTKSH